jgi:hypothetical protein
VVEDKLEWGLCEGLDVVYDTIFDEIRRNE